MYSNLKKRMLTFGIIIFAMFLMTGNRVDAAAKIKLNKSSAVLYTTGKRTIKLKAKVTGSKKKVKWKSSNKNVATVTASGKVTAKSPGSAIITAKIGKVKAKCRITVRAKTVSVKLTSLNPYMSSLCSVTRYEKDIFGRMYSSALKLSATLLSNDDAYAIYRINGQYNKFRGTIFLNISYLKDVDRTVEIYGDDMLLYQASIDCGDDSIEFEVNVSGIKDLRIFVANNPYCPTYIGNPELST